MSNRNMLQDSEFLDLIRDMDNADGVYITCTTKKGDTLTHKSITRDFPSGDMIPSLGRLADMAKDEQLDEGKKRKLTIDDMPNVNAPPIPVQVRPVRGVKRSGG